MRALLAWEHIKHHIKYCRVRKEFYFTCNALIHGTLLASMWSMALGTSRMFHMLKSQIPRVSKRKKVSCTIWVWVTMLSKERQAKRRANIKKDNEAYQTYLKKDRQRKAAQRSAARVALTTAEVEGYRLKERQRISDYRAKKKITSSRRRGKPATDGNSLSLHSSNR